MCICSCSFGNACWSQSCLYILSCLLVFAMKTDTACDYKIVSTKEKVHFRKSTQTLRWTLANLCKGMTGMLCYVVSSLV